MFTFHTVVQAPPAFADFIRDLVKDVKLPSGETPQVTDGDIALYAQAFVGPSSKAIIGTSVETNKNLEFLGDAALGLSATQWLCHTYPREDVGRLTHRKQCIIGNNSGLMDLAKHYELEKYAVVHHNRGGRKLLPNIVEAIIGVMHTLHGFQYADAFLVPLFNTFANEWFDRYLPEGIKLDIAKSASMVSLAASSAVQSQPDLMTDTISFNATTSYRNMLNEYLAHRHTIYPHSSCGSLSFTFELIGEEKDSQWAAHLQIDIDESGVFYMRAQGLSKKSAQNEASYLLLKVIQDHDARVHTTYSPCAASPPSVSSNPFNDVATLELAAPAYHRKRTHSEFSHEASAQRSIGAPIQPSMPHVSMQQTSSMDHHIQPLHQHIFPWALYKDLIPTSNYKGLLLTSCQRYKADTLIPEYTVDSEGPPHAPHFRAQVRVRDFVGTGTALKKNEAEQHAAKDILLLMCEGGLR